MKNNVLESIIFLFKANRDWFHSAHHVSKGQSFISDHDKLYGKIYKSLDGSLDEMIEKSISMLDDENIACPIKIGEGSLKILSCYTPPANLSGNEIAELALEHELNFLLFLEDAFRTLEGHLMMSIGLNDFLSSLANEHEKFVYKLKQRLK